MSDFDGLRLMVQFYRNKGGLSKITDKSGVDTTTLKIFCDTGKISDEDRKMLHESASHPIADIVTVR